MRRFGVEIECGDVNTYEAAKQVFTTQGLAFSTWKDRHTTDQSAKPRNYNIWNVSSDPTIMNSDGSKCQTNFVDETGELVQASAATVHNCLGAELISRVYEGNELRQFYIDCANYLAQLKDLGATFKPEARQTIHVHVEVLDWGLEEQKQVLQWVYDNQTVIKRWTRSHGAKYPVPSMSQQQLEWMLACETQEELWVEYRRQNSGRVLGEWANGVRKIVSLSPQLNPASGQKTAEWRLWPSSGDPERVLEFVELSLEWTDRLPSTEELLARLPGADQ